VASVCLKIYCVNFLKLRDGILGSHGLDSRKKRFTDSNELAAVWVVRPLSIGPLNPVQLLVVRLVFCFSVRPAQMASQDTSTVLPFRLSVRRKV